LILHGRGTIFNVGKMIGERDNFSYAKYAGMPSSHGPNAIKLQEPAHRRKVRLLHQQIANQ
jgi:hypothetical protein